MGNGQRATIIIPARLGSTRLPNKLILDINGESVIRRTIKGCLKVDNVRVLVLTEDPILLEHVKDLCESYLTPACKNGTERILGFLDKIYTDIVINVQGDEPFVQHKDLERMISILNEHPNIIQTFDRDLKNSECYDPNNVKMLKLPGSNIIGFTRSPLFLENYSTFKIICRKHIGIYGFSLENLEKIRMIEPTINSIRESLEQISWLENKLSMSSIRTTYPYISIDTREDLIKANKYANLYKEN